MKKICKVRFDDGHVEIIDEGTVILAKSLEVLAQDPEWGPQIKVMAMTACFTAAAREALKANG